MILNTNSLIPMSDQDIISPHNINHASDENRQKCQFGEFSCSNTKLNSPN